MTINIGINGLGRIGRAVVRAYFENNYPELNLAAINVSTKIEDFLHLLKYDSSHGRFNGEMRIENGDLIINNKKIKIFHGRDPQLTPWDTANVEIVFECTGAFKTKAAVTKHFKNSVKKILISAPSPDPDATIVFGVNNNILKKEDNIISVGSCTTNALAPIVKILNDNLIIESGYMTTIHAYTNDQNLVDNRHSDVRRSRAAGLSMIPTSTGAAKAIDKVLPELAGKLSGSAIRVPIPNVSMIDLVVNVNKPTTIEEINSLIEYAAKNELHGILSVAEEKLVSIDFNHCKESVVFDPFETSITQKHLVRVAAWYDNEWGFSCRMLDLASYLKNFIR